MPLNAWSLASIAPGALSEGAHPAPELFRSTEGALTVAEAWRLWGVLDIDDRSTADRIDGQDHWWRHEFDLEDAAGGLALEGSVFELGLDGVATIADVYIDGVHQSTMESMFCPRTITFPACPRLLEIAVRSTTLHLDSRKWSRPRWKTRLVSDQRLRNLRTSLLGRISWSPPTPIAGPYAGAWLRVRQPGDIAEIQIQTELRSSTEPLNSNADTGRRVGRVSVSVRQVSGNEGATSPFRIGTRLADAGPENSWWLTQDPTDPNRWGGFFDIEDPALWFPWTHGEPALHEVVVVRERADGTVEILGQESVGFRTVSFDLNEPQFVVNGVPIFARGAVAFPFDVLHGYNHERMLEVLGAAKVGGLNMIRLGGTNWYEDSAFHRACDRLGIMVWQDLPFASLDYPSDNEFQDLVGVELSHHIPRVAGHPSTVLIAGSSEVEQQAAMMGRGTEFFDDTPGKSWLADVCARLAPSIPYVSSSPTGGNLPMRVDTGIAHYFGVGAYKRSLSDSELSGVRFASECLAFSQIDELVESDEPLVDRVPRDPGADWDFAGISSFYRETFLGVSSVGASGPSNLDSVEPDPVSNTLTDEREKTAAAVGETMAEVFTRWRAGTVCSGGLVLSLNDPWPSDGWGLVSHRGSSKRSFQRLAHVLQPTSLLALDRGLSGLDLVAINDGPRALAGTVRAQAIRGTATVLDASLAFDVEGRSRRIISAEELWNRFADPTYAYRFGPRSFDYVVATWFPSSSPVESDRNDLAAAYGGFVFAVPGAPQFPEASLCWKLVDFTASCCSIRIESQSVSRFIHVSAEGHTAPISMFDLGPGHARTVQLFRDRDRDRDRTSGRGGSTEDPPVLQVRSAGRLVRATEPIANLTIQNVNQVDA